MVKINTSGSENNARERNGKMTQSSRGSRVLSHQTDTGNQEDKKVYIELPMLMEVLGQLNFKVNADNNTHKAASAAVDARRDVDKDTVQYPQEPAGYEQNEELLKKPKPNLKGRNAPRSNNRISPLSPYAGSEQGVTRKTTLRRKVLLAVSFVSAAIIICSITGIKDTGDLIDFSRDCYRQSISRALDFCESFVAEHKDPQSNNLGAVYIKDIQPVVSEEYKKQNSFDVSKEIYARSFKPNATDLSDNGGNISGEASISTLAAPADVKSTQKMPYNEVDLILQKYRGSKNSAIASEKVTPPNNKNIPDPNATKSAVKLLKNYKAKNNDIQSRKNFDLVGIAKNRQDPFSYDFKQKIASVKPKVVKSENPYAFTSELKLLAVKSSEKKPPIAILSNSSGDKTYFVKSGETLSFIDKAGNLHDFKVVSIDNSGVKISFGAELKYSIIIY